MDYNSQVIKGPPPMHMDEQDFQAYIDASVDSSELPNDAEEDEYLTRCVVDVATRKFYLHSNIVDLTRYGEHWQQLYKGKRTMI